MTVVPRVGAGHAQISDATNIAALSQNGEVEEGLKKHIRPFPLFRLVPSLSGSSPEALYPNYLLLYILANLYLGWCIEGRSKDAIDVEGDIKLLSVSRLSASNVGQWDICQVAVKNP